MVLDCKVLNVFLIGSGGTGGWAYGKIQYLLNSFAKKNSCNITVNFIIIDGDIVEQKNCIRQIFTPSDVGKNKAVALYEKYTADKISLFEKNLNFFIIGKYFIDDINRSNSLEFFISEDFLSEYIDNPDSISIVISLTDNTMSKKSIHNIFSKNSRRSFIIDGGNEEKFGQCTISDYNIFGKNSLFMSFFEINSVLLDYNDTLKVNESCADHDEIAFNEGFGQTAMANIINSNLCTHYLMQILDDKVDELSNETSFFIRDITFFNSI